MEPRRPAAPNASSNSGLTLRRTTSKIPPTAKDQPIKSEPPPSEPDESDAESQPIRKAERLANKKKAKEAAAAASSVVVKIEETDLDLAAGGKPVLQLTKKQQAGFFLSIGNLTQVQIFV